VSNTNVRSQTLFFFRNAGIGQADPVWIRVLFFVRKNYNAARKSETGTQSTLACCRRVLSVVGNPREAASWSWCILLSTELLRQTSVRKYAD
jgi:hypothetical protein